MAAKGLLPLLLFLLGASLSRSSSPVPKLSCWLVEEAGGGGSVMASALKQRPAILFLPPPGRRLKESALESELPPEVEAGLAFQVLDPSGALWGGQALATPPPWLSPDASKAESFCEINNYAPQESHVSWAEGLGGGGGCPRTLEKGKWLIASIQAPDANFGVSSVLHTEETLGPGKQPDGVHSVTTTEVVLSVFTRTPRLQSRLGRPVVLHCAFSAPASAFSVEWRHQFRGGGKVVLAYDGASQRVSVAEEGAELLLDAEGGGASLRLRSVAVHHEGTYICTIYLPHLHAQQALEFKVVEPPQVTLRPTTLSVAPGARPQLACEVSGFYPLGALVSWKRKGSTAPQDAFLDIWDSGHRQGPNGTSSFTSFARLLPVPAEDHGVSYICHVHHVGLGEAGVKKVAALHVAGSLGPSLEDAIGLFLVAIVLLGVLRSLFRWATEEKPKPEKAKSE